MSSRQSWIRSGTLFMKRHNSLEEANPLHTGTIFEKRATESSNYIQNIMHLKLGKPTRDNVKQFNWLLFLYARSTFIFRCTHWPGYFISASTKASRVYRSSASHASMQRSSCKSPAKRCSNGYRLWSFACQLNDANSGQTSSSLREKHLQSDSSQLSIPPVCSW